MFGSSTTTSHVLDRPTTTSPQSGRGLENTPDSPTTKREGVSSARPDEGEEDVGENEGSLADSLINCLSSPRRGNRSLSAPRLRGTTSASGALRRGPAVGVARSFVVLSARSSFPGSHCRVRAHELYTCPLTNTPPAYEFRGESALRSPLSDRARGAGGLVYEVVDREHGSRLALKTLRALLPESILLLKNEFRAIQGLNHPNLVTPKELFEDRGQWFFTMEFIEGTDFLAYVRPNAFAETPGSGSEPTVGVAPEVAEQEPPPAEMPPLDEGRLRAALGQLALGLSRAPRRSQSASRREAVERARDAGRARAQILDLRS